LFGIIIEEAAAMPWAEAYQTHIYEPLGMKSTFLDCYEEPRTDAVHGYIGSKGSFVMTLTARALFPYIAIVFSGPAFNFCTNNFISCHLVNHRINHQMW
jgi:CubicO group peptidase (beta-lactamase class C family)